MERTLGWIATIVALAVALLLPGVYFVVAYQSQDAILKTEAEINSRLVTLVINSNPELWEFEKVRLEALLARRPSDGQNEARSIKNLPRQVLLCPRPKRINQPNRNLSQQTKGNKKRHRSVAFFCPLSHYQLVSRSAVAETL